jgi:hypothetical protein
MLSFARIFALHDLGRMEEFEEEFQQLRSDPDQSPEGIARIYAWTGNNDLALEWLEKMIVADGPEELGRLQVIPFKFTPPGSQLERH